LDLEEVAQFQPHHVSPYCLTLPKGHHLNENRPSDDVQIEMFEQISSFLQLRGYQPYEISNFALPGYESKHNSLYWSFDSYWGLGLSSHSFYNGRIFDGADFTTAEGKDLNLNADQNTNLNMNLNRNLDFVDKKNMKMIRFWNSQSLPTYLEQISKFDRVENFTDNLSETQFEILTKNEALTDFCHVSLRTQTGLSLVNAREWFGIEAAAEILLRIQFILEQQKKSQFNFVPYLEQYEPEVWRLSPSGILISNQIFADFLFTDSFF
jgi:oxygen-independent coproporphyrinogen-3 oxidase